MNSLYKLIEEIKLVRRRNPNDFIGVRRRDAGYSGERRQRAIRGDFNRRGYYKGSYRNIIKKFKSLTRVFNEELKKVFLPEFIKKIYRHLPPKIELLLTSGADIYGESLGKVLIDPFFSNKKSFEFLEKKLKLKDYVENYEKMYYDLKKNWGKVSLYTGQARARKQIIVTAKQRFIDMGIERYARRGNIGRQEFLEIILHEFQHLIEGRGQKFPEIDNLKKDLIELYYKNTDVFLGSEKIRGLNKVKEKIEEIKKMMNSSSYEKGKYLTKKIRNLKKQKDRLEDKEEDLRLFITELLTNFIAGTYTPWRTENFKINDKKKFKEEATKIFKKHKIFTHSFIDGRMNKFFK